MYVLSVIILLGLNVLKATASCPTNCTCTSKQPFKPPSAYNNEGTLLVICPPEPSEIDLTPLKDDPSDKFLIFMTETYKEEITLKKDTFPRGLKLTELSLRGLKIISIDDDAFENLQYSLRRLDLTNTKLKVIGEPLSFLAGLIHLDILELYYNYRFWGERERDDLSSIFKNTKLEKLRVLNLASCSVINMTDDALSGLESLVELDLSQNKIPSIPRTLNILRNLEILDLSKNRITTLKGSLFQNNKKLKRLLLSENPGLEVKFDAFIGLEHSLHTLDLESTGQTAVPTVALSRLKLLKYLNISDNAITEIERGSLQGGYCLHELALEKVNVQIHSEAFEGQTSCIRVISVSGTDGTGVPTKALQSLNNLEYLKYSHNSVVKTLRRGSFSGVKATTIVLEDLKVNSIEKGAFDGVHIPLSLYLKKVDIRDISFVMDYPKGTFKVLSMRDVPVACDCHLVLPVDRLECALTGKCVGAYPYHFLDGQSFREKISSICPNAPDFSKMYLKCRVNAAQTAVMQSTAMVLTILVAMLSFV